MKKTSNPKTVKDLQAEYRFAGQLGETLVVVVLDPDVAKVFTTAESVNAALRALITVVPRSARRKTTRKSVAS